MSPSRGRPISSMRKIDVETASAPIVGAASAVAFRSANRPKPTNIAASQATSTTRNAAGVLLASSKPTQRAG